MLTKFFLTFTIVFSLWLELELLHVLVCSRLQRESGSVWVTSLTLTSELHHGINHPMPELKWYYKTQNLMLTVGRHLTRKSCLFIGSAGMLKPFFAFGLAILCSSLSWKYLFLLRDQTTRHEVKFVPMQFSSLLHASFVSNKWYDTLTSQNKLQHKLADLFVLAPGTATNLLLNTLLVLILHENVIVLLCTFNP